MPGKSPEWITVKEAARMLGVSPDTVRYRIKKGDLEARVEGNKYLVNRESVEEMIRKQREISAEDSAKISAMETELRMLKEKVRELEADKAYLQERVIALEKHAESLQRSLEESRRRSDVLLAQLHEYLTRPWWKRVFGRRGLPSPEKERNSERDT